MSDWLDLASQVAGTLVDSALGEPLTYRTQDGQVLTTTPDGRPLRGVFDESFEEARLEGDVVLATTQPMLFVRGDDLPARPVVGDTALIRDTDYRVRDVRPDGSGGYTLPLERLSP